MLEIKTRRMWYVVVVDVIGHLSVPEAIGPDAESEDPLGSVVRKLLDDGERRILLNFTAVSYIDSYGVGELFGIFSTAQRRGAEVKLVNPCKTVQDTLYTAQLHRFLEIKNDWAEALQSFSKPLAAAG